MHQSRGFAVVVVVVASTLGSYPALADPEESTTPTALLGRFSHLSPLLVGAYGGGRGAMARAPSGFFFGADSGWARLFGSSDISARSQSEIHQNAWCFGARAGYQFASGVAMQARFDNLGVTAPDGSGSLDIATVGLRYSVPIILMPFAEAMVGPAFHGSSVSPGVGLGVGVSLLAARHIAFDLSLRDWLIDIDGVRHVPTLMLGITAGFSGSP